MNITRSIFATAALSLLLAVGAGNPSMARGGGGGGGGGGHGGGFGGGGHYEGGEGAFGGTPFLNHGGDGGFYGGHFGGDRDGYRSRLRLPYDASDYDDDEDYSDYYCGRTYPSYNAYTNTYVDTEGKFRHCP